MTVHDVVLSYLNHLDRMEKKSARHSRSHARVLLIQTEVVEQFDPVSYQMMRKDFGAKPATINRELEILKQAVRHWNRMRLPHEAVTLRYVPRLPENNVRQGFFEEAEAVEVLAYLPTWLHVFCRFAYVTGWRKSEIAGLRWEWVNWANGDICLPDSKNGEGRRIPLAGPLIGIMNLARTYRIEGCPWVFHDPEGNKIRDFRKRWLNACAKAGSPNRLFHDFRRTAVRNMIEAGIDREVAKKITGHKTDSMFARYQIVDQRQMISALEKL